MVKRNRAHSVIPAKSGEKKQKNSGFTPSAIPANVGIHRRDRKAFTLIELLVVIAIIALLLSILTPALNTVKERAKRILCKNRLRQWAISIFSYNSANDSLMHTPRRWMWGGKYGELYPHYMGQMPPARRDEAPAEWDVFRINPYIGAFVSTYDPFGDPQICGITDLVACPNASGDFMTEWCTWNCEEKWDFNEPGYSYWVIGNITGADGPEPIQPGEECGEYVVRDLTIDSLSPKRLLMSEILAIDEIGGVGNPYRYNHGKTGWSWFASGVVGHRVEDPYPVATGRSQVFGDGHVEWRDIDLKYENNLPNTNDVGFQEDRWNGPGSGWMGRGDTSYY